MKVETRSSPSSSATESIDSLKDSIESSNSYNNLASKELNDIKSKLDLARKESQEYIKIQNALLTKIEQHENDIFHKIFTSNRDHKVSVLKARLVENLFEAYELEEEREMLEHASLRLSMQSLSNSSQDMDQDNQIFEDDLMSGSLQYQQLTCQYSTYNAERAASASIKVQLNELNSMYRQALQLLGRALTCILSSNYRQSLHEFLQGPMPLAIEASRLLSVATMLIQPEAKRRYPKFASGLSHIKLPVFKKFNIKNHILQKTFSTNLSPQLLNQLKYNEGVVLRLQKVAAFCMLTLQKWNSCVEQDLVYAENQCKRLQTYMMHSRNSLVEKVDNFNGSFNTEKATTSISF